MSIWGYIEIETYPNWNLEVMALQIGLETLRESSRPNEIIQDSAHCFHLIVLDYHIVLATMLWMYNTWILLKQYVILVDGKPIFYQ